MKMWSCSKSPDKPQHCFAELPLPSNAHTGCLQGNGVYSNFPKGTKLLPRLQVNAASVARCQSFNKLSQCTGRLYKSHLNQLAASSALLTGLGTTHRGCPSSLCQGQVTSQHAGGPHLAAVTVLACHSSFAEALAGLRMARFCPTRRTVALCQGKKIYTQLYAKEVTQLPTNLISNRECYFSLICQSQSKDRAPLLLDLFLSTTYSQDTALW